MGQRLFSQYQQQTQTPDYKVEPVPRDLIPSLGQSKQQILWLGCSDSGYEETTTLNHLLEDEMIVVRNWGNMALSTDLAWASAVQHAVEMLEVSYMNLYVVYLVLLTLLQVKHIIVCGHYGCGIVKTDSATNSAYPWQKYVSFLSSRRCMY